MIKSQFVCSTSWNFWLFRMVWAQRLAVKPLKLAHLTPNASILGRPRRAHERSAKVVARPAMKNQNEHNSQNERLLTYIITTYMEIHVCMYVYIYIYIYIYLYIYIYISTSFHTRTHLCRYISTKSGARRQGSGHAVARPTAVGISARSSDGDDMEVSMSWGTPIAGWFISWKILSKYMI